MRNQIDAVIITALAKERDAVLAYFPDFVEVESKNRTFYRASLPRRIDEPAAEVVLLSLSSMGTASAAVAATQAIDVWNPTYLVLVGIAGGARKHGVRLGDIVVASQIVGYEPGEILNTTIVPRFEVHRPSRRLLELASQTPRETWAERIQVERPDSNGLPDVHVGVIASGDKVIKSAAAMQELGESWRKLLAVDMEGFGVAQAVFEAATLPGMLLVKSICDWADETKNDDWQEYSAHAAASFALAVIQETTSLTAHVVAVRRQSYTGKNKIRFCRRLGDDHFDLADYFDIEDHHRRRFIRGRECQGIWEWLKNRKKLDGLPDALKFIERDDLLDELEPI